MYIITRSDNNDVIETDQVALKYVLSTQLKITKQPSPVLWMSDGIKGQLTIRAIGGLTEYYLGREQQETIKFQWCKDDYKLEYETKQTLILDPSTAAGVYTCEVSCNSRPECIRSNKAVVEVTRQGLMKMYLR